MKKLAFALEDDVYRSFKIRCVRDCVSMSSLLRGYISDFMMSTSEKADNVKTKEGDAICQTLEVA